MKTKFTLLTFIIFATISFAQTTFKLEVAAEGNFGTPTGDIFRIDTTVDPATNSSSVYQTTNNTTGFDVLQDFKSFGNRALIAEKPAGMGRIVITDYPALNELHTFEVSNAPQTLILASTTKGYVSTGNPSSIQFVDLENNTLSAVIDPNNDISSYSNHMLAANGMVYVQIGSKIVKIDTLTQTVTGVIQPGIGSIVGLVYDDAANVLWTMNGSGNLVSIEIANNDALGIPVNTNISGTSLLRFYDGKLYFWKLANKALYIYNTVTSELPLTPAYTSTIPGGSWSIGYGRSFAIDTNSGDFVICSADAFTAPSKYEVVDGTNFTVIQAGEIDGCAIANNCSLETFPPSTAPVPDLAELPTLNAECSIEVEAPTANNGSIIATTEDPLVYEEAGTYLITWTYDDGNEIATQTQEVVIEDETAPTPDVANLPKIGIACNEALANYPLATDNCEGTIIGVATEALIYDTPGEFTITWTYTDQAMNTVTQTQILEVSCSTTGIDELSAEDFQVYPNPTSSTLTIEANGNYTGRMVNTRGQEVLEFGLINNKQTVQVNHLPKGIYFLQLHNETDTVLVRKVVIQ
ncbi:MAG TPA: T9SS type A sorting domain-containing protein [Brumimicrobium sp.]|nr:T9SS type A sorting domain-containing protein [Brumimicrobium sp.]